MANKRGSRVLPGILAAAALLLYAFFSLTGFSVQPPKNSPPFGATVWFYRRGTRLPFLSSPDSQLRKAEETSSGALVPILPQADRVLARFSYNRALYLRTTGGVEFLK
jgi:hypothetical protein